MPNTKPVVLESLKKGDTIYAQLALSYDIEKPGEFLTITLTADAVVTENTVELPNATKPISVKLAMRELFDNCWFFDPELAKSTIIPVATSLSWFPQV